MLVPARAARSEYCDGGLYGTRRPGACAWPQALQVARPAAEARAACGAAFLATLTIQCLTHSSCSPPVRHWEDGGGGGAP